jgi:hypothetical protein
VATTNGYERHRILLMYHLLVGLLLGEMEEGLGGAWAFVLRDIIYTLIHHFNSRWGLHHALKHARTERNTRDRLLVKLDQTLVVTDGFTHTLYCKGLCSPSGYGA